ncbi:MAG: hypothetical protein AAB593_01255, partial [Patescibacteria group bacterium]
KVTGDNIYNSKNVKDSYIVKGAEDSKFCQYITSKPITECYDYTEWGNNASLIYESVNSGEGTTNSKFNSQSWSNCRNIEYTTLCLNVSDIFGCISLLNKQFYILNKEYSETEYKELKDKIIKQMMDMPYKDKTGRVYKYGEFFPAEISPYGYNETTAQEYFPLSEQEIKKNGYNYVDIDKYKGKYSPTIKASELPDHIKDANESIVKEIIECLECKKAYKLIKQEFDFYKKQNIALPRECSECRYLRRFKQKNFYTLSKQKCMCAGLTSDNKIYKNTVEHFHKNEHCPNEFQTTYFKETRFSISQEKENLVYCEECYLSEVV